PALDIALLQQVGEATEKFLSLHGGSGIDPNDIHLAIQIGGITKVNVNTDLRVAFRSALEQVLKDNPDTVALYKIFSEVVSSVQVVVERWIDICGSANKI
ncbi:MAG TPA: class II fructose-bisphosphate aldolase, partial [Gammaproteobacteria bacterium]|nr:class II fructose-bisphosphate aldolase [Gammaproteobacteria bacterium]